MPAPAADAVTGLVLAGGRGARMGGLDKGLQAWHGRPLAAHVVARLAPQVASVMISANRNAAAYAALAARVLADEQPGFPGPLAGILAGLRAAPTPWLAVVPCDAPRLPADLVARLAAGLRDGAAGAVARRTHADGRQRLEPVCCLLATALADDLAAALAAGERRAAAWVARHAAPVDFDRPGDADAFANFNTLAELEGGRGAGDASPG
jgi:molybdopterin-guanine dinucleotide biosynthesis protein A